MRKLIVKYFALNYTCEVLGKRVTFVRAANIIVPTFFLNGILTIANESGDKTIFEIIALILLAIVLFIGFVYFRIKPVKFNELDENQKHQYGIAALNGLLTKEVKLTKSELGEWIEIDEKLSKARKNNFLPLLVNPISLIIFLLIYYFFLI